MYKLYSSGTKLFLFSNIYNDTTSVLFKENVSSLVSNSYGLALDTPDLSKHVGRHHKPWQAELA